MKNPTDLTVWKEQDEHYNKIKDIHMRDWFEENPDRFT